MKATTDQAAVSLAQPDCEPVAETRRLAFAHLGLERWMRGSRRGRIEAADEMGGPYSVIGFTLHSRRTSRPTMAAALQRCP